MDLQNESMHLVLSTDAKPRLKWIPELHQRFVDAVNQLGGPEKATPKGLMKVMGIPGLTLYHLKSHLQKFRLGKSQQLDTSSDSKQEDFIEVQSSDDHCSGEISIGTQNQMTEGLQIAHALQMQMEVQRKLHEQIEVQRHLQLRIESQGKYLQSVLKKAQEALAGYNSSATGIELAKAELSHLLYIINNGSPSSPISEITETRRLSSKDGERKQNRGTMCSLESSLTSSESSGRKEKKQTMAETQKSNTIPVELPLMATFKDEAGRRKRSGGTDSDESCVDQPCGKKLRRLGFLQMLDLNSQYQSDGSSSKGIDLNSKATEHI